MYAALWILAIAATVTVAGVKTVSGILGPTFLALVLAIADTWAHLVGEGWSARDAVDHCEAVVGQSLDESCVAGLRRALERDQLPQVTS